MVKHPSNVQARYTYNTNAGIGDPVSLGLAHHVDDPTEEATQHGIADDYERVSVTWNRRSSASRSTAPASAPD